MRKQKALGLDMVSACDTRVERPRYPDLHKQYFINTVEESEVLDLQTNRLL